MKVVNGLGQTQVSRWNDVIDNAYRTLWLSGCGGWITKTDGDGGLTVLEQPSSKTNQRSELFIATTVNKYHEYNFAMPYNWDGGPVLVRPYWYTIVTTATGTVTWVVDMRCWANGDSLEAAYGTSQERVYTFTTNQQNKLIVGETLPELTPGGSAPAGGQYTQMRVYRKGDDTYANDVYLLGLLVLYKTKNYSDAES